MNFPFSGLRPIGMIGFGNLLVGKTATSSARRYCVAAPSGTDES
jgi:hypothetical protein